LVAVSIALEDVTPSGQVSVEHIENVLARLRSPPPDGHLKLLHLWPVKLLQAGQPDYDASGLMASRAAASLSL